MAWLSVAGGSPGTGSGSGGTGEAGSAGNIYELACWGCSRPAGYAMTESRRVEWTEIGWLEVDSATVGFGDNACRSVIGKPLLDLHFARGDGHGPIIDFTAYGVP